MDCVEKQGWVPLLTSDYVLWVKHKVDFLDQSVICCLIAYHLEAIVQLLSMTYVRSERLIVEER